MALEHIHEEPEPNRSRLVADHAHTMTDITFLSTPLPAVSRTAYTRFFKRGVDILAAAVALLALAPVMIVVALAITLDSPGPALFRQTRIGKDGRRFTMFKFRTMRAFRHHEVEWLVDTDGVIRHKVENDPRITRVGRFLRRTSIDELPQVVNILLGHMSLIGPRPELPEIVRHYEPWQHRRHQVRPGLTGWWQVNGRSNRPMHENTHLDLYYIDNVSFRLDLAILARTAVVVLRSTGAF